MDSSRDGIIASSPGICHSDSNYKEISQPRAKEEAPPQWLSHFKIICTAREQCLKAPFRCGRASSLIFILSTKTAAVHFHCVPHPISLSGVTFKRRHGPFINLLVSSYALFDRQRDFNAIPRWTLSFMSFSTNFSKGWHLSLSIYQAHTLS